jgi:hypothetical protein
MLLSIAYIAMIIHEPSDFLLVFLNLAIHLLSWLIERPLEFLDYLLISGCFF